MLSLNCFQVSGWVPEILREMGHKVGLGDGPCALQSFSLQREDKGSGIKAGYSFVKEKWALF